MSWRPRLPAPGSRRKAPAPHAAHPEDGNNALTGLIAFLNRLPLAPCRQAELLQGLGRLFPHGDVHGTALGVDMEDEVSGRLTLAFSMLTITEDSLDGTFDSRCPICATRGKYAGDGKGGAGGGRHDAGQRSHEPASLCRRAIPTFVQTLLRVYEEYTGRKGSCQSMGGGTYVHHLKNGVAFGAAMPETDNRMHGADEFAVLDELLTSAKIFAQVIVDLCQ